VDLKKRCYEAELAEKPTCINHQQLYRHFMKEGPKTNASS